MSLCQCAEDSKTRYNAEQAIYAWDELVQQLYRTKPINRKQFEKAKERALRIIGLMGDCPYKEHHMTNIKQLQL